MLDTLTSILELVAVVAFAVGAALIVAASIGGLLGAGCGIVVAGVVVAAASGIIQWQHRGADR